MKKSMDADKFQFGDLHPRVRLGTASDRYAGWIGQIYTEERYAGRISKRSKTVAGKKYEEQVLPVDSVEEYFQHFSVLELDFTFYSLLLDRDSKPTQSYWVLREYRDHLGKADHLILKAPQAICAKRLPRRGRLVENTEYLDSEVFFKQFYEPANEILGGAMSAVIFEEAYLPKQGRPSPEEHSDAWERFFRSIPKDNRYHWEVRTEALLTPGYFNVLEKHGIGQVFSHWTWLPPLSNQFNLSDHRFFNAGQECIIRLITPRRVRYEDSYKMAFPFNQLVDGMLDAQMIEDAVGIVFAANDQDMTADVIINNRAGGNAPAIAQRLAASLPSA